MAAPRSFVLTGAAVLASAAIVLSMSSAFVAAPQRAPTPTNAAAQGALPTAALSAVALAVPTGAHADEGSVWIPALSAVGAGFAIGTDGTERFLIEDTSSRSGPLLSLSKGVLRLGAHKVEARSVSTEGGVTVHGVGQWRLVVAEDFAEQGLGWSRADVTRCGGVTMLGGYCKFSKGEVNKTFSGIAPHTQLRVVATYHFIDRWIGEAGYLKLNIGQDRAPVVVWSEQHSQEKSENGLSLCGQQETPEGKFSATIDVTLAHREDSVQLTFGSTMKDSDPCDESWGVSGVELYTRV